MVKKTALALCFALLVIPFKGLISTTPTQEQKKQSDCAYKKIHLEGEHSLEQFYALAILAHNPEKTTYEKSFLQKTTCDDFEILQGRHQPEYHLLARINRTQTHFGRIELAKKLITPSDNITALRKNQKIIRELVMNSKAFDTLDRMIKEFKTVEPIVMSFWPLQLNHLTSLSYRSLCNDILFMLPNSIKTKIASSSLVSTLDKSPLFSHPLPYAHGALQLYTIWAGILFSTNLIQTTFDVCKKLHNGKNISEVAKEKWENFKKNYFPKVNNQGKNFFEKLTSLSNLKAVGDFSRKSLGLLVGPFATYTMFKNGLSSIKGLYKSSYKSHEDLIKLGTFINQNLKQTIEQLEKNPNFKQTMPELSQIRTITHNATNISAELTQLLNLLKTKTFSGKPSAIFSHKGKILAVYRRLEEIREKLIPMLQVIGKLDAYLSLAKLYRESKKTNAPYCFVQYTQSHKPVLTIKDFWNPFIDPKEVVTNSLKPANNGRGKNIIISGPNAGGKSTAMKAIGLNIVMAQALGIAPARHLEITPFSYIETHLNMTDDIATKKSLYMAEATRVKKILDNLEKLPKDKFGFIIADEIFNSTNPESGSSIGRAIGRFIANKLPNCICIIASHLSDLTNLEKDTNGIFKNYKVSVQKAGPDIIYPYKLMQGKADQSIAIEILKNLKFDEEITKNSGLLYQQKLQKLSSSKP